MDYSGISDIVKRQTATETIILDNGLTLYLHTCDSPYIAFDARISYGSAYETDGELGSAHLSEHLFNRTNDREAMMRAAGEIEQLSGLWPNAYTAPEVISLGLENDCEPYHAFSKDDLRKFLDYISK